MVPFGYQDPDVGGPLSRLIEETHTPSMLNGEGVWDRWIRGLKRLEEFDQIILFLIAQIQS